MKKASVLKSAAVAAASLAVLWCGASFAAADAGKTVKGGSAAAQQPPAPVAVSGKVVETMSAGGYTYVQLEQAGKKTWVAAPEMKGVQKGQVLLFRPGYVMPSFKSNTLKRTFDSIVFSPGLADVSGVKDNKNQASPGSAGAVPTDAHIKVDKAPGPNGHTVAELYEQAGKLAGKEVAVRGRVVKVSRGIMGKNWLHIQDGTGVPEKGTHDLVVTTSGDANTGDTVTVKGKLTKDKDFGSGYKYDVIMENATVSK